MRCFEPVRSALMSCGGALGAWSATNRALVANNDRVCEPVTARTGTVIAPSMAALSISGPSDSIACCSRLSRFGV